jgi:hypothetical protein
MSQVAPASDVETTIYLIGDAGAPDLDREPVLEALASDAANIRDSAVIVFLGDNVYPRGLPAPNGEDREEGERRLRMQVNAVIAGNARGIFIPGNHDWDFAGEGRRESVLRAEMFAESIGKGQVEFIPADGCPGPETVDVGRHIRLVLMDTQWWLFENPVEDVPAICASRSKERMLDALRSAVQGGGDRHVIVAGHHPIVTHGPHGGYFTARQHIFPLRDKYRWAWIPLPLIGSLYPMARRLGISDQDVFHRRYQEMTSAFDAIFREKPPLAYAAGHEHSLQLITGIGARYQIVSGTGNYGHLSPVAHRAGTLFAASRSGYVRLQVQQDARVRLGMIFVAENGDYREAYSIYLE